MFKRVPAPNRVRRVAFWALALACLFTLAWAGVEARLDPGRRASEQALLGHAGHPSLALDLAVLAVALGYWVVALRVAHMAQWFASFLFLMVAWALGAGLLSTTQNDWGPRLFYLLLAWCSPALFALHYELISRPPARPVQVIFWVLFAFACLGSLPPLLWTRRALEQAEWSLLWRQGVRLMLLLSALASLVVVAWYVGQGWPKARRRPIRLIVFGNAIAVLPLMLHSLLPSVLGFPTKMPWEISFLGLLFSPILYSCALMPTCQSNHCPILKRISIYYLLWVSFCFLFLLGMALLYHFSPDPRRDWPHLGILLTVSYAFTAGPLLRLCEHFTDSVFFGKGAGYNSLLQKLAESLPTAQSHAVLQRLLLHDLASTMHLTLSALFLLTEGPTLNLVGSHGAERLEAECSALPVAGPLAAYLLAQGKPLSHQQARMALADVPLSHEEEALLSLTDVAVWLPLVSGGVLSGVLLIGAKQGGDPFTAEDRRTLADLARQAGIAAHNLRWAAEVRRRLEEGREAERQRLAQEIHDGPVQDLEAMRFQLGLLPKNPSAQADQALLSALNDDLLRTIDGLRVICRDLRPPALAPFGLAAALRSDIERLQKAHPEMVVQAELADDGQTMPVEVRLALYRIYREAVSNILRHAQARTVQVRLSLHEARASLTVCDDGLGFQVPNQWIELGRQGHLGLLGAAELVESLGGHLEVVSAPGKGTTVRAVVPSLAWKHDPVA